MKGFVSPEGIKEWEGMSEWKKGDVVLWSSGEDFKGYK